MLIHGHSIYAFPSSVLVTFAFVLVISGAPPIVFFWVLLAGQRRASGMYGALATALGRELEGKWLDGRRIDAAAFETQVRVSGVPAGDGQAPCHVVARDVAAEPEPPHVIVRPKPEHVPNRELQIDAKGVPTRPRQPLSASQSMLTNACIEVWS